MSCVSVLLVVTRAVLMSDDVKSKTKGLAEIESPKGIESKSRWSPNETEAENKKHQILLKTGLIYALL